MVLNLSEPALDLVLYGNKSSALSTVLQNQLAYIQPGFNDFSNRVYQNLQNTYNFIHDKMVQYNILREVQGEGIEAVDNYFYECNSFAMLQNANTTMQRWIMSHPQVRQYYLEQNVDGYSNTYQNVFGKDIGIEDYNYRRVMNEVLIDGDDSWKVQYFEEDLMPNDKELTYFEKIKVLHTYDTIDWILESCGKFDFTNSEVSKINRS